jgi:hypothetical protein
MEDYNRLISSRILDGYEGMLDTVPQPQMLGGKRMRNFVLPASTEYDYPGTLSVGTMDGKYAETLGGSFFKDFNQGFPMEDLAGGAMCGGMEGGAYYIGADGKAHSTNQIGNPRRIGGKKPKINKRLLGNVLKVATKTGTTLGKPFEKTIQINPFTFGYDIGHDIIGPEIVHAMGRETEEEYNARKAREAQQSKGGKIPKGLKKFGKIAAPVAKDVGMALAKEAIKEGVKSAAKSGGRRKRSVLKSVGKVLKSVGKVAAPIAEDVFKDVILPEGKKALRDYIRNSMKSSGEYDGEPVYAEEVAYGKGRKPRMPKMVGTDPRTYTPAHLLAEGGALIRDDPSQFHSSVYPPALASYAHSFPRGKDAYGRGIPRYSKSPISKPFTAVKKATGGARSARGAIVSEVMKKHGLSLAEASKFVKEKGLY